MQYKYGELPSNQIHIEKEHLKGKTIIMVSHSKEFEDMTNQIVMIKDKKIYAKENN